MKPIRNEILIKANRFANTSTGILGDNGKPITIDIRYELSKYYYAAQIVEVVALPLQITMGNVFLDDLKVGDKIYIDHVVCQKENEMIVDNESYFFCKTDQVWGILKGDIIHPVGKLFYAKKIVETKDFRYTVETKNNPYLVEAVNVTPKIQALGVNNGDLVVCIKNAGVPIKNTELCWLTSNNVLGVVKNNEIYPLEGLNLIEQDNEPEFNFSGKIRIAWVNRDAYYSGIFIRGEAAKQGDKVKFVHGMFTKVEFNNKIYGIVKKNEIISIL